MMREVIPGLIWIGNAKDGSNAAGVLSQEIDAVVHLAMEEPASQFPREICYCRFPLLDGVGNSTALLRTTIHTVASLIKNNMRTLVACGGGMSRSPAIVAAALAVMKNESPDEWLTKIATSGPHDVAPAFWYEIRMCLDQHST